jgi:hypothetical protein
MCTVSPVPNHRDKTGEWQRRQGEKEEAVIQPNEPLLHPFLDGRRRQQLGAKTRTDANREWDSRGGRAAYSLCSRRGTADNLPTTSRRSGISSCALHMREELNESFNERQNGGVRRE